jgi:hypothetical protein
MEASPQLPARHTGDIGVAVPEEIRARQQIVAGR